MLENADIGVIQGSKRRLAETVINGAVRSSARLICFSILSRTRSGSSILRIYDQSHDRLLLVKSDLFIWSIFRYKKDDLVGQGINRFTVTDIRWWFLINGLLDVS